MCVLMGLQMLRFIGCSVSCESSYLDPSDCVPPSERAVTFACFFNINSLKAHTRTLWGLVGLVRTLCSI